MSTSQKQPLPDGALESTERAILAGFVRTLDTSPSFVVPLFRRRNKGEGRTTLFAQLAGTDHTISRFVAFDIADGDLIPSSKPLEVRVGTPCLVAYELGDGEILIGSIEELRSRLADYIENPSFDDKPFSQWELCEFCDRIDILPVIAGKVRLRTPSKTWNYFLANVLARSWIDKCLRKDTKELGRPIENGDYTLFVRNGNIAFSVSDTTDRLDRERIAVYVNLFNESMAATWGQSPEVIYIHKSWLGSLLRGENRKASYESKADREVASESESAAPRFGETRKPDRQEKQQTIGIVDPWALTREGLVKLLESAGRCFRVLAVARPAELLTKASEERISIDVILVALGSTLVSNSDVRTDIALLSNALPDVPIIVLCDVKDSQNIGEALRQGIRGYIPTTLTSRILIEALRLIQAGGTFIPADALSDALSDRRSTAAETNSAAARPGACRLTPRQSQVLELLRAGKPNKIIAYELAMRESTVKVHVRQIMRKLQATNRTEAAFLAFSSSEEEKT